MLTKCHGANFGQARFFHSKVASGTPVGHLLFRNPDLLDASLEVSFEGDGVGASADEM